MSNIEFNHQNSLISNDSVIQTAEKLKEYTIHLSDVVRNGGYEANEGSINLSFDENYLNSIKSLGDKYKSSSLKYIIVIGIGGSNLGTMALYNALRGQFDSYSESFPKIIFAETVSSRFFNDLLGIVNKIQSKDEILINVISKSGGTTETISIFETLREKLEQRLGSLNDRIVVTSDEGSKLYNAASEKGIDKLSIPAKVGGRFSVFSAVGMFPLYVAGFDVDAIHKGARDMISASLNASVESNYPLLSAVLTFLQKQNGISINNNFFFNIELEYIGRWYRQLMGESIGKEKDAEGNTVHQGITPIVSIGSTDLHSMAQLYIGGPNDKFTQFVYFHENIESAKVPNDLVFPDLVSSINGKSFGNIMDAIINGVKTAYRNASIPYTEVTLYHIDEHTIANYLQFKMLEMMYLGKLLGLNTFDQPNVEDYKKVTRSLLAS